MYEFSFVFIKLWIPKSIDLFVLIKCINCELFVPRENFEPEFSYTCFQNNYLII